MMTEMRNYRAKTLAAAVALVAIGCGHSHDEAQFICDGSEDPYTVGHEVSGSTFTIELLQIDPIPHTVDINTLQVQVKDANGDPVDCEMVDVLPFTAKHDHGTPIEPEWTALGNGMFEITNINYVHRGPWFLNFEVRHQGVDDMIQFTFCIVDPEFEMGGDPA